MTIQGHKSSDDMQHKVWELFGDVLLSVTHNRQDLQAANSY